MSACYSLSLAVVLQLRSGGAEIFGSDLTLGEKMALKSQNFAVEAIC